MPDETQAGVTPAESPSDAGVTPSQTPPATMPGTRDADGQGGSDDEGRRDANLDAEELRKSLGASRRAERDAVRELKRLQDAERQRADAEKSELQLANERADAAEARATVLEREKQATQVAAELGVSEWVEELYHDEDTRSMRAHAQRIRERLGRNNPGMDGGVRAIGVPAAPQSMDDILRQGVRR